MMDPNIEKKLRVLTAITTLHRSIGAKLDLRQVAGILVRELTAIVDCEGCAVLLVGDDRVEVLAECGFSQLLGTDEFSVDMPAIRHLIETRSSILAGDVSDSPAAACVPSGCAMKSLVCTPILVAGQVRGIIHLDSPKLSAFDEDDLTFIEVLAGEVAVMFERSFAFGQMVDISYRDGLTGVLNRRSFDQDLVAELERAVAFGAGFSLLMIDADRFKDFNDRHGHQIGDSLLKELACVVGESIRPCDRVYRYGGEEFAVLLPKTNRDQAMAIAERLREAVAQRDMKAGGEGLGVKATVSLGVATFPEDAGNESLLLKAADGALYHAKQTGRNRACAASDGVVA